MFSAANRRLFLTAKDRIARRIITGPKAANYEAEFSQSGAEVLLQQTSSLRKQPLSQTLSASSLWYLWNPRNNT
jgi:hypothetical protein